MNKLLLATAVFTGALLAQNSTTVGVGSVFLDEPYVDSDAKVMVLPFFDVRYNGFYLKGLEGGFEHEYSSNLKVAAFIKGRLDGYEASDSAMLAGMEDRSHTVDGGAKITFSSYPIGQFTLSASHDLLANHKGYEIAAEYSRVHAFSSSILVPFLGVKYQDSKLSNYYYGVRANEATPTRVQYELDGSTNFDIGVRYIYNLNQNSSIFTLLSYTKIDSSIEKSPIIEQSGYFRGVIAYGYKF